jgi:ABC-type transporter Mla subunit MlaD
MSLTQRPAFVALTTRPWGVKVLGWLSDGLLLGGLLSGLIVLAFLLGKTTENSLDWATLWAKLTDTPVPITLSVPFDDANEITQGAPVRMMGLEIGMVDKLFIRPLNAPDHVELRLKTIKPIPNNATVTVLFTGLGGSKSVEILPPVRPLLRTATSTLVLDRRQSRVSVNNKSLVIEQPIRMHDSTNSQIQIAKALQGGAINIAKIMEHGQALPYWQQNIHQVETLTQNGHTALNQLAQQEVIEGEQVHQGLKKLTLLVTKLTTVAIKTDAMVSHPKIPWRQQLNTIRQQLKATSQQTSRKR